MTKLYYYNLRKSGWKYQTSRLYCFETPLLHYNIKTEWLELTPQGYLYISKGYCWNGCSGPTRDTKTTMRAGLVHDALYQLMRLKLLPLKERIVADEILRQTMINDGAFKFRANYYYWAVRNFGEKYAKPQPEPFCEESAP